MAKNDRSFKDGFDAGVGAFMDMVDKATSNDNDDSVTKRVSDAMKKVKDDLDD